MLDCFGINETFILNFWKGIEYVAKNLIEKPFEKYNKINNNLYNLIHRGKLYAVCCLCSQNIEGYYKRLKLFFDIMFFILSGS